MKEHNPSTLALALKTCLDYQSLKDREVTLYDGLRFLSPWRQQHLAQRSSAATSRADVRVTHPKFQVLALATPQRHARLGDGRGTPGAVEQLAF